MPNLIRPVQSAEEIVAAAQMLRCCEHSQGPELNKVLDIFERWSASLEAHSVRQIAGLAFLRLWLRRATLEPIVRSELGPGALGGTWQHDGRARLGVLPIGVVGHWPAGNIDIQPVLSLTCALLGGNACLVRIPTRLVETTRLMVEKLVDVDPSATLLDRVFLASFNHDRVDLHSAMARAVDGAMVWGGQEAVAAVRALPFPRETRFLVFGPRISAAAMEPSVWADDSERARWCRRLARDVWQFDQAACSSPQTLFLEAGRGCETGGFVEDLAAAFAEENRRHPRTELEFALASAICQARASWLLADSDHTARFPASPDWTILVGKGAEIPTPTQGRTLTVLLVDDLIEAISLFDGSVQTLGLAIGDPQREAQIADVAARRGVDRIVKIGQMHTFGAPWDGNDLIRPMTRVVRYMPSSDTREHSYGRCTALSRSGGS